MTAALFRFMTLIALVLMPFGMVGTPAAAQQAAANQMISQKGHCDEQPGEGKVPAHSSQQMHCAMCTAVPASEPSPPAGLRPVTPLIIATVSPFDGIELEIATPPPRLG